MSEYQMVHTVHWEQGIQGGPSAWVDLEGSTKKESIPLRQKNEEAGRWVEKGVPGMWVSDCQTNTQASI